MIIGNGMRLRGMEREDLPCFVRWLNDHEVRRGISIYLPISSIDEQTWFENMLKRPPEEHPLTVEVEHLGEWEPVGNIGLFGFDWRSRQAEVGICIGEKSQWNKGVGTQAMQLILQHAFLNVGLNRVHLRVFETNPRAVRSYEKCGFVHEGRQRQAHFQDGKLIDVLLMSILKDEWMARYGID